MQNASLRPHRYFAHLDRGYAAAISLSMGKLALSTFDDMRVEVAAHRLIIRAMLTYLACSNNNSAGDVLTEISGMLEGTGPYAVIADDLDDELRRAAIERARDRMAAFITNIQRLQIARV
jgi:hypothetical protein